MAKSQPPYAQRDLPPDPDDIRELQAYLVKQHHARIVIDGNVGALTIAAARRVLERGATVRNDLQDLTEWVARQQPEQSTPYVWMLRGRALDDVLRSAGRLDPGVTIWPRDTRTIKQAQRDRIGTCDTAFLVTAGRVAFAGVLLAGASLSFRDGRGFRRLPIRLAARFEPALVPPWSGEPDLDVDAARTIVSLSQVAWRRLVRELGRQDSGVELPLDPEHAYEVAMVQTLRTELELSTETILPDGKTAATIGWEGPIWQRRKSTKSNRVYEPAGHIGDARFPLVLDAPADSEDELDRGPLALFLAQRLHLIWCQINGCAPDATGNPLARSPPEGDTFIAQVDSPWGGGKTTFANFVARVLNPRGERLTERHFLRSSLAPTGDSNNLPQVSLDEVFVPDFARSAPHLWPDARRPWVISRYNAWRDQYVLPPWWHIFLTIERSITREIKTDAFSALREAGACWRSPGRAFGHVSDAVGSVSRWAAIKLLVLRYKLWNTRVKGQVLIVLLLSAILLLLWYIGIVGYAMSAPNSGGVEGSAAILDPKEIGAWLSLAVAILGLGGVSFATLMTVATQSLSPDLDFSAEHKEIGVRDPVTRFRQTFHRILMLAKRPVLLIVDDIDRCEPRSVVEILRGFQTIVRSPRLFVLLLGDRAWIESAHDVHHRDLSAMRGREGTLGSLFVQKVIQLAFRLPAMKDDCRRRFARAVLGDRLDAQSAVAVQEAIQRIDERLREAVSRGGTIAEREATIDAIKADTDRSLPGGLGKAERDAAAALVDQLANVRIVASSGADARQQQSVAHAVERLLACLPNNPRQIKRIFMAFSIYETVGRAYFGYRLTPTENGEEKAKRWRQLAIWVTLATEWPDTWRMMARYPLLSDAVFGPATERDSTQVALLNGATEAEAEPIRMAMSRLRGDPELYALLSVEDGAVGAIAATTIDSAAIYEFNRIIWEPGFRLHPCRVTNSEH